MTGKLGRLILLAALVLALPLSSWALGVDLTVHAGGGAAMGSTDDENKTGKIGFAAGGGAGIDLALLELDSMILGLSTGVEYLYLKYESELVIPLTTVLTSVSNYSYITFPVALTGSLPLNAKLALNLTAGGFAGYFLGGTSDNTDDPPIGMTGEVDLDDTYIETWQYGLRFGVAAEIKGRGKINLEPGLLFDLGLTDTTKLEASDDTFWALTAYIGCRYSLF